MRSPLALQKGLATAFTLLDEQNRGGVGAKSDIDPLPSDKRNQIKNEECSPFLILREFKISTIPKNLGLPKETESATVSSWV
jgi:hypothetical protein